MTGLIEKTIRAQLPQYEGATLTFLKYSTPTSGKNLSDKVLFFVFSRGGKAPVLVVKTVRSYSAAASLRQSFENLAHLNHLTEATSSENLFAKALYLHDDGEQIFSVETACRGTRTRFNDRLLAAALDACGAFAEAAMRQGGPGRSVKEYATEMIERSKLPTTEKKKLTEFFRASLGPLELPTLVQHGDVTEDNILVGKQGLCLVDYDSVGLIDLPGFDVFGLLYRYDPHGIQALVRQHLPVYFSRIGVPVSSGCYDALCFLYYVLERTVRKPYLAPTASAERLISEFKKV